MTRAHHLPPTPELLKRFADYYALHPAWGALHIVLEDGNVKYCHVEYCYQQALNSGDYEGTVLASALAGMSQTQRRKIDYRVRALTAN